MSKTSRPDRKQRGRRGDRRKEKKEFEETTISVDRVTRVVKGGRRMRFRAVVVVGNKKGKVGIGTGKSNEVMGAVKKAVERAKKDMITVPIVDGSIPHAIDIKYKAAKLRFLPAREGTGVIAGGSPRIILEHAGYKNVLSKRFGTGNKLVNAQAVMKALQMLRVRPQDEKAEVESTPEGLNVKVMKEEDAATMTVEA